MHQRYKLRRVIVVTSSRVVQDWGLYLGDAAMATTILDRFAHRCTMLEFEGKLPPQGGRRIHPHQPLIVIIRLFLPGEFGLATGGEFGLAIGVPCSREALLLFWRCNIVMIEPSNIDHVAESTLNDLLRLQVKHRMTGDVSPDLVRALDRAVEALKRLVAFSAETSSTHGKLK